MRNSPSSTKITALAVATFLAASINTTAEGKPNKEHREEEQQAAFAQCNAKRDQINDSMRPIRKAIIVATHPEYFRLHTVQEGDTWDSLSKSVGRMPDCFNDLVWASNNTDAPLVTGTQVILPSAKAASDWTTNKEAYAIILNYTGSRVMPFDDEWSLSATSGAECFDDKVIACVTATETKGTDISQCIENEELFTEFLDIHVVTCEESLGSTAKCQQEIRRACQRAMKTCDAKLQGDANALVYLRVAHDKLTSQKLKTHGREKR